MLLFKIELCVIFNPSHDVKKIINVINPIPIKNPVAEAMAISKSLITIKANNVPEIIINGNISNDCLLFSNFN
jgi:hypothetical protein